MTAYARRVVDEVSAGLTRLPRLVHVLVGARQTGKTTAADQIAERWNGPVVRASADAPMPPGPEWVETHWSRARDAARAAPKKPVLLVLDEVQKVRGWSESVKALAEHDRRARLDVRALLLGSSALLVQHGLTESLAGRFFLHRCPHWSFAECADAFGWSLDEWIFFGGYPGAAALRDDEASWRRYVADSLIETALEEHLDHPHVAHPAGGVQRRQRRSSKWR